VVELDGALVVVVVVVLDGALEELGAFEELGAAVELDAGVVLGGAELGGGVPGGGVEGFGAALEAAPGEPLGLALGGLVGAGVDFPP